MKPFFRDPSNLRHRLNIVIPIIVFLTSILSAVVARNTEQFRDVNPFLIFSVAIFSTLCVLVVILAMTQPLKEVVLKAGELVKLDAAKKEKSQMMEVYQLIERLMDIVKAKGTPTDPEKSQVLKDIEKLDYLIPLGYMSLMVAHEVRNPLSTITGMSELLKGRVKDETDKVYLEKILEAARRINMFTGELLDFTDNELEDEEFDLGQITREAVSDLRAEFRNILCEFEQDAVILYRGDRNRIYQTVYNILRNAFEFENSFIASRPGTEGSVHIHIMGNDSSCLLSVHNPHSTVEQGDIEAVFKPFFTKKKKGRGIGLFTSMRNVKMHGGDIKAESGDKGTTFTISLPANQA